MEEPLRQRKCAVREREACEPPPVGLNPSFIAAQSEGEADPAAQDRIAVTPLGQDKSTAVFLRELSYASAPVYTTISSSSSLSSSPFSLDGPLAVVHATHPSSEGIGAPLSSSASPPPTVLEMLSSSFSSAIVDETAAVACGLVRPVESAVEAAEEPQHHVSDLLGDSRDLWGSGNDEEKDDEDPVKCVGGVDHSHHEDEKQRPLSPRVEQDDSPMLFLDATNIPPSAHKKIMCSINNNTVQLANGNATNVDDELTQDEVSQGLGVSGAPLIELGMGSTRLAGMCEPAPTLSCQLPPIGNSDSADLVLITALDKKSDVEAPVSYAGSVENTNDLPSEEEQSGRSGRPPHHAKGPTTDSLLSSSVYRRLEFDSLPNSVPNSSQLASSSLTTTTSCSLCQHMQVTSIPFDFPRCKIDDFTVHVVCALWCPEVFYDTKQGRVRNIERALKRTEHISCSVCGGLGASVGCAEPSCVRSYHFLCALSTDGKVSPAEYTFRCAEHIH